MSSSLSHDKNYSAVHLEPVFERLDQSSFRSSFRLANEDFRYIDEKQFSVVLDHASRFVQQRLASAKPANDGKQTPMRGHPVFVAQHATATCCRACLAKWHGIGKGVKLEPRQIEYIIAVIEHWLCLQAEQSAWQGDFTDTRLDDKTTQQVLDFDELEHS